MSRIAYRPELDGLRAFAVVPVIAFHLMPSSLPGGYLGVDVFFVLSGYLITSILLAESRQRPLDLKEFWIRRVRRIAPALLTLVIIIGSIAPFLLFMPDLFGLGTDGFAAVFSYANFWMYSKSGDYWGTAAESSPYLHAWSLSVEEQFYVGYPLLLMLFIRAKASAGKWLSLIALVCLALFAYGLWRHPTATFYLLPFRAWELLAGCVVATTSVQFRTNRWLSRYGSNLGLGLVVASYVITSDSGGLGGTVILAVLGATLVVIAEDPANFAASLMSASPVVWIGRISYSLYLWHWPICVIMRQRCLVDELTPTMIGGATTLTVTLAWLSYRFVEQAAIRSQRPIRLCGMLLLGALGICAFDVVLAKQWRYTNKFAPVVFHGLYYDITPEPRDELDWDLELKREGIEAPNQPFAFKDLYRRDGIPIGVDDADVKVVVVGDSHGSMWGKAIDLACESLGIGGCLFAHPGNQAFFDIPVDPSDTARFGYTDEQYFELHKAILQKISSGKVQLVVICSRWTVLRESRMEQAKKLIDFAGENDARCLLLTQPPELVIGDRNISQFLAYMNAAADESGVTVIDLKSPEKHALALSRVRNLKNRSSNVDVFDVHPFFEKFKSDGQRVAVVGVGDKLLYYDDDHLSTDGTMSVFDELKDALKKSLESAGFDLPASR